VRNVTNTRNVRNVRNGVQISYGGVREACSEGNQYIDIHSPAAYSACVKLKKADEDWSDMPIFVL
jgi:hypothetical protein